MIDLSPLYLEIIKRILKEYVPGCDVRVFGSRVNGTAKKHSDLDLAVVDKEKIPTRKMNALREAFEDSDLPIRVDVLDWHAISADFRAIIEKRFEVL